MNSITWGYTPNPIIIMQNPAQNQYIGEVGNNISSACSTLTSNAPVIVNTPTSPTTTLITIVLMCILILFLGIIIYRVLRILIGK